jgi:hypothetical protein
LYYDATAAPTLRTLQADRHIPTPTEAGSWFTDTPYGTIVTNGVDRPVIVNPWPLGNASESATAITRCCRPFGFASLPAAPEPLRVNPMPAPSGVTYNPTIMGSALTLWCPSNPQAISDGARWGLGFGSNTAGSPRGHRCAGHLPNKKLQLGRKQRRGYDTVSACGCAKQRRRPTL